MSIENIDFQTRTGFANQWPSSLYNLGADSDAEWKNVSTACKQAVFGGRAPRPVPAA